MTRRSPQADHPSEAGELWGKGTLGKQSRDDPEIVFAQVREDAAVEVTALSMLGSGKTAFCIGSGGCTALSLLTVDPAKLHVVDINAAQIYLIELKKAAFEWLSYEDMSRCMTIDAHLFYPTLRPLLSADAQRFWDGRQHLLALGLNQCGLIEINLKRVMRFFRLLIHNRRSIEAMLHHTDLSDQQKFYRENWDNWRWRQAFTWGLSGPMMRLFYGRRVIEAIPDGFAQLMKEQIDEMFRNFPVMENGHLWQTFLGTYPPGEEGLPVYLRRKHHAEIRTGLVKTVLVHADAATYLTAQPPDSIDFFALSNVFEVTSQEYAAWLMKAIIESATPGALICLRSIFPPDADSLSSHHASLKFDEAFSSTWQKLDRSLFCRFIRVFRVNKS